MSSEYIQRLPHTNGNDVPVSAKVEVDVRVTARVRVRVRGWCTRIWGQSKGRVQVKG